MKIELLTKELYDELVDINNKYPALFLQNIGYEGINRDTLTEEEKKADKRVNEILKEHIKNFSRFQNFCKNKNGELRLRFQYHWSESFTGVGYILVEELLNGFRN